MSDASTFQDRYHIRFKGRRTTVTLDKILSNLIAAEFGVMPDRTDYHSTVQQWLQATLTDKLGQNVPGGVPPNKGTKSPTGFCYIVAIAGFQVL